MKFIRRLLNSVELKLTVPIIAIFVIVLTLGLTSKIMDYNHNQAVNTKIIAKNIFTEFKNKVSSESNTATFVAAIYSAFPEVIESFKSYYLEKDLTKSNKLLKEIVAANLKKVKKLTDTEPGISFVTDDNTVLYSNWISQEINAVNGNTISRAVEKIMRPVKGIAVGQKGIVVVSAVPVFNNRDEFLGTVETTFPIESMFDKTSSSKEESFAVFLNQEQLNRAVALGYSPKIAGNTFELGKYSMVNASADFKPMQALKNGISFEKGRSNYLKIGDYYYLLFPLADYSGDTIGMIAIQINISNSILILKHRIRTLILIGLVAFLIILLVIHTGIYNFAIKPIRELSKDIQEIAKGKLVDRIEGSEKSVMADIYKAFNIMLNRLVVTSKFAEEIGDGNFDAQLGSISEGDVMSMALIEMKNKLIIAKDLEAKNKKEEANRTWAAKGLAFFSEILRSKEEDIDALSESIIANLVKYTGSNQGAIFIVSEENTLKLTGAYAYDRKKWIHKEISMGEGLVGTCALERETIFLTDIPQDYITISSGLGTANPNAIIIVPLKIEDKIFGVVELASFTVYEDYQIKFVEELAESIASALNTAKTNLITSRLLIQSKIQAEELASQEEELRQNLEEMQATEEQLNYNYSELKKKNNEMNAQLDVMNASALVSKTDLRGIITYVNDLFCQVSGYSREELIGRSHNIIRHPDMPKPAFEDLWDTVKSGKIWSAKVKNRTKGGDSYWVDAHVGPIRDKDNKIAEYIAIRYLITDYIDDKATLKSLFEAYNKKFERN